MKKSEIDNSITTNIDLSDAEQFSVLSDAVIMQRLSSQIYSNPIEAVVRELATNAYDAQAEAGCANKPFDAHIPIKEEPYLLYRDYGTGMSEEFLKKQFTQYGGSTRQESNKFVGQIGWGSKSPLAYNDFFNITSYHGGKEIRAICMKNDEGVPCLKILEVKESDKPQGFQVHVPVQLKDVGAFQRAVSNVFTWFETKPNLNIELEYLEVDFFSENFGTLRSSRPKLIMGNVAYNISPGYAMPQYSLSSVYKCDIGDVDINVSREELQYTKKTLETLKRLTKEFKEAYTKYAEAEVGKAPNRLEACITYSFLCHSWLNTIKTKYNLVKSIRLKDFEIKEYRRYRSNGRSVSCLYLDEPVKVFLQDKAPGSARASTDYASNNNINVWLITKANLEKFCNTFEITDQSYIDNISEHIVVKEGKKRKSGNLFKVDLSKSHNTCSEYLEEVESDPTSGVYIPIKSSAPKDYKDYSEISEIFKTLGEEVPKNCYAVRPNGLKDIKNKQGWTSIQSYIHNLIISKPENRRFILQKRFSKVNYYWFYNTTKSFLKFDIEDEILKAKTQQHMNYWKGQALLNNVDKNYINLVNTRVEKANKKIKEVFDSHPLFKIFEYHHGISVELARDLWNLFKK